MLNSIAGALLVFCCAAFSLTGCGRGPDPAAPDTSTTAVPVRAPEPPAHSVVRLLDQPYISFLPFFIGMEEGYFAEQRIELQRVTVREGPEGFAPLIQGEIDVYGGLTNVGIFNAIAGGAKIRIVADKGYAPADDAGYSAFVVRKDVLASGRLADPANWKGMKFDTSSAPSTKGYLLTLLLRSGGVKEEDIQIVSVPPPADCEALRNGSIDATMHAEPWVSRMVSDGYGAVWKSAGAICPDFQMGLLVYGQRLLEQDRDAGNRFMVAYLKSVRQYMKGKTDRNLEIAAKHTKLDIELLRATVWPPIKTDGSINAPSLMDFQKWCGEQKVLNRVVPETEFLDPRFAEYATKALATQP